MKTKSLIAWIGNTDLRASRGELREGVGPIAMAVQSCDFDEIHLLSDHKANDSKAFAKWLREEGGKQVKVWPAKITGPTRFSEIYEAATKVLQQLAADTGAGRHLFFHISPWPCKNRRY
jgi:hypothetical protein